MKKKKKYKSLVGGQRTERESFCLLLGLGLLLFFFFERENFQKSLSLFQRDFIRGERRRRRRPNDDDDDAKNDFEYCEEE